MIAATIARPGNKNTINPTTGTMIAKSGLQPMAPTMARIITIEKNRTVSI